MLDLTAAGATGVFNAVGAELTFSEMLGACLAAAPGAELCWVPDADNAGFMRIDGARARAAGLRHRPLAQTAADTLAALRPEDGPGLDPALEARLIAG